MGQEDVIWTAASFGEVIRRAREAQGLTQKALAARCDISGMYVSQIETQQRIPALPTCRRLAQALGKAVPVNRSCNPIGESASQVIV